MRGSQSAASGVEYGVWHFEDAATKGAGIERCLFCKAAAARASHCGQKLA